MRGFVKSGRNAIFKVLTATVLLGAFTVFMGALACAQEKSVTEQILDIMLQSRQISQDQYDALLKKAEAEKLAEAQKIAEAQKAAAKPPAPSAGNHGGPTAAEATGLGVTWRNGVRFSNEDKTFDIHVGGRLQWDVADSEPNRSLLNWAHGADVPAGTTFSEPRVNGFGDQVRRARLLIDGTVYKNYEFCDQFEFAPSYSATTVVKSVNFKKQTVTTTSLTTGAAVTFADVWLRRQERPLSRARQDRTDVRADRTRATEVR